MSAKAITIAIAIVIIIIMIIYILVIFELYKSRSFIFETYTPKSPPSNLYPFYPLGEVRQMTQEEIDQRNDLIMGSLNTAS